MKKKELLINFILDQSGSMDSNKSQTISGFNEYLQSLKKKSPTAKFSLTLFNTEVSSRYLNQPLREIEKLTPETYRPDGGTALYDAVVETVEKVSGAIDELKVKPKVLVVIMTDGQENSSRRHNQNCLRSLIENLQKEDSWTFAFLGANQDSWANASQWGFYPGNVINYVSSQTGQVFNQITTATASFATNASGSTTDFFKS